ncbi:MAG: cbb3-type cytochrome c oxidase subunit II [Opitutaceae bacterium]
MKNGFFLVIGAGLALALAFAAIVLGSVHQLNALRPYYDDSEGQSYPAGQTGLANEGAHVYAGLDCAACHTQAVRRPGFGADSERGWGERQSVARDYIFRPVVRLGESRIGPDLANFGGRQPSPPTEEDLYTMLYEGQGGMPAFPFLFDDREVTGQRSYLALPVPARAGHEIVPTRRARALVAYLLSLNSPYVFPEAKPAAPPAGEGGK